MDYNKIGNFITSQRKLKKLTQAKLAEKLFVSEKTVSKWENGKGVPDTNSLAKLCDIFDVSINELLNGEKITTEDYKQKSESTILDLQKLSEHKNKTFFKLEALIICLGLIILFSFIAFASFLLIPDWAKIAIYVVGFVFFLTTAFVCIKIEQVVGFYECKKCNNKYIPTFAQINFSMHMGKTRYMKCPHCKKRSWSKKVLK